MTHFFFREVTRRGSETLRERAQRRCLRDLEKALPVVDADGDRPIYRPIEPETSQDNGIGHFYRVLYGSDPEKYVLDYEAGGGDPVILEGLRLTLAAIMPKHLDTSDSSDTGSQIGPETSLSPGSDAESSHGQDLHAGTFC